MKTAIRLLVSVVMAVTSAPVFAAGSDATGTDGERQVASAPRPVTTGAMAATNDADVGGGGGETSMGKDTRASRDDGSSATAAGQEYSHQKFLEQTWMAAP